MKTLGRGLAIAAATLLGACSSLPYRVDSSVVVPAGGRASARLDLTQVAPLELELDVESAGEVKLAIDTLSAGHTSSIEVTATFPPHHFRQRFDRDDGVLTIAVQSTESARVRCRIAGREGVDLAWIVTADAR
jgi:hypothetical protein